MTVARFLRVLLLLVTATTLIVEPAGASSAAADIAEECTAEFLACNDDFTCDHCSQLVDETSSSKFQACADDFTSDGLESSTVVCTTAMAGICCMDEASDFECVENDEFVDFWLCTLVVKGCFFDEITCDEDGGPVDSPGSSGAASSSNSTADIAEECADEIVACTDDFTCDHCSQLVDETSSPKFQACADDFTSDGLESSTAVCTATMAGICCIDEASDFECVENDEFVDFWLCTLEVRGCFFDEITCDEDGGPVSSSGSSGATATAAARHASIAAFGCALFFVAFLPLLWA